PTEAKGPTGPTSPRVQLPNGPRGQRSNGPAVQRPNGPTCGGGPFVCVPGPSDEKHLPDSREGLPDSREGGHDIDLRYYHGHVMAMTVFMGMDIAMLFACYGHAISFIINMVMEMSRPWACHSHGQSRGQNHDFCQTYSKGYISGQGHGDVRDKDSGQGHEVLKIMNLAKIMAWLWYGVGHGDGHEFEWDHGQDI
ncbi:MAG: hypothetical protein VYC97_11175, partial [SAR324 cluster bacterium]|nr:hypothetical protein [SAR324 cluster bacterium]